MKISTVLDASAPLAYLHQEKGGDKVREVLSSAALAAVNLCEVLNRYAKDQGLEKAEELADCLRTALGSIEQFGPDDAIRATAIYTSSRHIGLSLADCVCLALGKKLGAEVRTCDRNWSRLDASYRVVVIR